MAELSIACPICGGPISADTEVELIKKFQAHSKEAHGMDVPEEKVKEMMAARGRCC